MKRPVLPAERHEVFC